MKYIFAGGGTGGHIFPAIAIAEEIIKMDKESEILFIGAKGRIEEKIVPANNFKLETIEISGFDRKNFLRNGGLAYKIFSAYKKCLKVMKNFKPDIVIGTGGFVSGPVVYAAYKKGIPVLIQEGNSFAGKTIKFLSDKADRVVINFEETKKYLKRNDNVIRISHPIRSSLTKTDAKTAREYFGLPPGNKTIFVFGGSQGASGINKVMNTIAVNLYSQNLNIIWQTGKADFDNTEKEFSAMSDRIKVKEFIDRMDLAYSASDVVICRAGITSIMEIAYMGSAAILIPLPAAAENHQELNARSLEARNAAIVILQSEIEKQLFDRIMSLIHDPARIKELAMNVKKISDAEAGKKIAEEAIKIIGKG